MTEAEWKDRIDDAIGDLLITSIHLDHVSISDFRLLVGRLDALVFQGFRLLHDQRPAPAPRVGSLIDLTD